MSDKSVYEIIKRQNGEKFAKCIRDFDSGIFEVPNLAQIVRYAGRDAFDLLPYLVGLKPSSQKKEKDFSLAEDLTQLAKKAGYQVIYADTLEKQNQIRPLFFQNEELCTFHDPFRFQEYHIFHFIKEGAENLNRANFFGREKREDEYGTSVLSVQISKKTGNIKICNRYNHTVESPDNTFGCDPDQIIDGLTLSLEKQLGQKIGAPESAVPDGYLEINQCLYQFHLETDNIFYGVDFYVKNHQPFFINKDYQLMIDAFMIDFQKGAVRSFYDFEKAISFVHTEYSLIDLIDEEIKSGGKLTKRKENDLDVVCLDSRPILKARNGVLTYVHLKTPKISENGLFCYHDGIEEVYLDNLERIGKSHFQQSFFSCSGLKVLSLPKLQQVADNSILHLPLLERLNVKDVKSVKKGCLNYLGRVREIDLNNCFELEEFTISKNRMLQRLKLKKVKGLARQSLVENPFLEEVYAPLLKKNDSLKNHPIAKILNKKKTPEKAKKIKSATCLCPQKKGERTYE